MPLHHPAGSIVLLRGQDVNGSHSYLLAYSGDCSIAGVSCGTIARIMRPSTPEVNSQRQGEYDLTVDAGQT
jgi:hypothetical protein